VNGRVSIRDVSGEIEASSVSGDVTVESERPVARGEFSSVSGRVGFDAPLAERGRLSVESVSGSVLVLLPESLSAAFSIETFSGSIDNGLGPAARKTSEWLPAQELSFTRGAGDATVSIESFSGRVELRPR
jgi:DUF4097 and DUF4098 domain-containing protein YvlB